jgi:hypothetical protein
MYSEGGEDDEILTIVLKRDKPSFFECSRGLIADVA